MAEGNYKKGFGDRKDGKKVRDVNGMNYIMHDIQKRRNDNEVYGCYTLDITNLVKYVNKKNELEKDMYLKKIKELEEKSNQKTYISVEPFIFSILILLFESLYVGIPFFPQTWVNAL